VQLLPQHHNLLQAAENLLRHPLRQIHKAVVIMNIDLPDVPPLQAGLIGNGADNIPRLHAVNMPHLDPESLKRNAVGTTLLTRRLTLFKAVLPLTTRRPLKLTAFTLT
jgi:hypothetical protein